MKPFLIVPVLACLLLSACGKDFNEGFGEMEGWGGYTKGYGDLDESYKSVGLCSYTGGCMSEDGSGSASSSHHHSASQ